MKNLYEVFIISVNGNSETCFKVIDSADLVLCGWHDELFEFISEDAARKYNKKVDDKWTIRIIRNKKDAEEYLKQNYVRIDGLQKSIDELKRNNEVILKYIKGE